MIKVLIVEDDQLHSNRLTKLLHEVDESIKICKTETNIKGALQSIGKYKPNLVFIDILLENGETGFELVKEIDEIDFNIIFISAHLNYENTLNAIRLCALDFLPKPFIKSELEIAILKHKSSMKIEIEKLKSLKKNINNNESDLQEIWIANGNEYSKIEIVCIIYAKSDNEITIFHVIGKNGEESKYTSSKSIGEWERILANTSIFRIHNQYLINLKHVTKYTKGEGGLITMKNDEELPVSRLKKNELLKSLKI